MPIEIYKDEEGNEKKRYVLPQGVAVEEESQTKDQETGNNDDDFGDAIGRTLAQGGRDLIQNIYDAGYDTLADLGFQDNAGKTNRFTGEEAPPGLQFGLRNPFQGEDEAGNDYRGLMRLNPLMKYREEGDNRGLLGLTPTSFDKPDAPLPFYGKPLPEFAENGAERFVGQMISSISQFMIIAKGLKARGIKVPQVPIGGAKAKALLKTPGAKGIVQRVGGRFIRGAQEGWLPGAINDVALEDPWDGNAATMFSAMLPDGEIKELVNAFQVDEDDSRAEAMLKNGIIGTFLAGPLLGGAVEQIGGAKREGVILVNAFADYLTKGAKVAKKLDIERGVKNPFKPATDKQVEEIGIVKLTGREKKSAADQAVEIIEKQDKIQKSKDFQGTSGTQLRTDGVSEEQLGTGAALRQYEAAEKNLKTVISRTKHIAELQGGIDTTKNVDIQPPTSESMATIDTNSILVDPKRFQFKDLGRLSKTGTSGSLRNIATYNSDLAGVISVWKDPVDGQTYVVNGHNRLAAAKINNFPTMNVRYLEAPDAETAKVKGAMQNIAEGNGTGVDAAKIMRSTKMGAAEMMEQGISPSGAVMKKAIPLSKLPGSLFDQVAAGKMTEDMGAAIGSSNAPDQVMFDLAKAANKKGWSANKTAEAASIAQFAKVSEGVDPNALPLPGFDKLITSNFENILNVRIAIRSQLRSEINALGVAANAKKAGTLESVGNVIDVDASKAARDESMQGELIFNRLANLSGPLNDVINELAKKVKGNTRAATVVQGNIKKIKNAITQENIKPPTPVKQTPIAPENVVKNNPTEINKKPDLKNVQVTVEPTKVGTTNTTVEPTLPRDLKRKDINYRGMRVSFSTDIDYAAYVVTKKRNGIIRVETTGGSKRNADYLNFLMNDVGFTEQDIVRIKSRTLEYLSNNYASGSTYRFTGKGNYYFLGLKPGQLSLDPLNGINPIHKRSYGTLGNDYSGATLLNYREKFELVEEIERMAGKGVNIQFVRELEGTLTAKQAADYGLTEGDSYSAAGEFISGKNPADDLIMISMFSKGGYRGFSSLLRTAFHESFHRIQKRLLSKADKQALIAGEKEIRDLAAKTMPEFKESILDGTLGRQEIEAIAFSDWYMRNTDYPKATWSEPFRKIAQIIERTGNFLKGRGYQTWDDVFERSMRGETAEQALGDSISAPATQLAIDPPDPDSFTKAFDDNLEAINNGDMSIEDALANDARRLISRSGKTQYVESPTEATLAANKTINDVLYQHLFDRAEATGIPTLSQAVVFRGAINFLKEHGGDAETLIPLVERALKGDLKSQEDLIAIRALQIQRDRVLKKLGVQAQAYMSATGTEKATELQGLKAMLGDQIKLDIAYMSPLRKSAQVLNLGKTMFRDDIDLADLPSEVTLRKGTSKESGEKALADGFDTTQETGSMGQAVYFTTDEGSIKLQDGFDNAEVYGDLINDIKILDLSAMNKRVTDLITDLGLGQPKKTKNGLELTPEQIEGVKAFLAERGYAGIRYEPRDTGRPNAPADEIAIFDNNSANRIVGSDASVPPTATPDAPKRTLLEQAISKSNDVLNEKLDPDMQNIAEGNGTGVDAAKIMRSTKMGAAEMMEQGISPSGAVMKKAIPLSKLPGSLFDQVAAGKMTEDMGAAIGSSNAPDQVMFDLAKAANKKGWSANKTAEAASIAQFAKVSEGVDPNALPLPGFDKLITSNFENILNVRIAIRSQLRSEINALGVAANAKKAGTLESVGNVIDVDASKAARDESMQGELIFNRLANLSGPLNDVINELAKKVKGNTRAATVVQGNIKKIKNAITQENIKPPTPVKQTPIAPENVVKNNPTEINKKPDLKNVQVTVEPTKVGTTNTTVEPTLPRDLKRKDINYRGMRVSFSTDIDYAAYVVTKKRNGIIRVETTGGSKRNADYLNFLMNDVGFTEQDIVRIKSRTLEYLSNNYASGSTYRFTGKGNYYFLGLKPGQLSLDPLNGINPIHKRSYGTLGNDYSGATLLNYREKFELVEEIERMAGKGVNIQFVRELEGTLTAKQAADYGLTEGDSYSAAGEFISGKNPADDLIMISMFSKGGYRGFSSLLRTAFHESFHRIQKRLLSKADKQALIAGEKEIRDLAAKTMPEFKESILDGTLGRQEIEAIAFSDWYMRNTDYPKATWSEPFRKIAQIIERTGNFLKGRGYQTWDDVFERSMRGETAEQALGDSISAPATQLAIDPPDPDSFTKAFDDNLEAINNGDMSIEDALANDARRLISRSGKTQYVESPTEATLAANKTINDVLYQHLFDRAEATGIPTLSQAVVFRGAINFLKEHGGDAETLIPLVERALKGDLKSQEDLIAIRALQIQRDRVLKKLGVQAQAYMSATGTEKATELQGLKAMLGDQIKLDIAYMSPLRKSAQVLNLGKTMFRDDIDLADLPSEVTLRKGTSKESGEKALADGFDTTQETGSMGQAVYFTTDEGSIKLQDGFDNAEVYGDLINDIKILDLSAMNKRVTDLITDLGLGQPKKTKNGLELTPEQIEGVKAFLAERGYAGIRYEPRDTGRPNAPADEIAIFDNNSANRIVGSDASVPPTATPDAPKRTLLEQAISKSNDVLNEKLDPDLLEAIDNGKLTPEAEQAGDVMVAITNYAQQNKGFNKHFTDLIEQTPDKSLTSKRLLNYYRGAILLSGETTWKMMIGGLYRAATLPVIQSMGGFTQGFAQSLKGNKGAAYKSYRRARLSAMLYGKYYQNLGNALRLMKATILENETFGNLGVDQMQLRGESKYNPVEQMNLGSSNLEINKKNDIWYTDPNNKNWIANTLVRVASVVPKTTGRLAGSVDTLMSSLVGPSQEWVRYVDQELYKAETVLGMRPGSDEAWEYASNKATELVKAEMVDVTLSNGKTIQNAALTGQNGKYVMDWVNFTDSLDVVPAPRTYEYGVREARESGITDPAEVHNHAKSYVDNDSNIFKENKVAGAAQFLGGIPKAMGNLVENNPAFGLIYPLPRGPVNIVKASARSLGVTAPLVDTFWRDLTSEDVFARDRAIGEISFGITTLMSGIALYNTGLVEFTGFRSPNYRRREVGAEGTERGREPMSIRFKNPFSDGEEWSDYYSLQTLDTLSNIFGSIGEYVEFGNSVTEEQKEEALSTQVLAIAHVARSLGAGQFTKSILSSITELFDVVAGFDQDSQRKSKKGTTDSFSRYIERRLSGFMPAFVRKMNTGGMRRDIVASELPYPFSVVDNTFSRLVQQVPGFNEAIPPVLHNFSGEPINERHYAGTNAIPEDMPWMRYLYNLVTPASAFPSRTKSAHPVDVELSKLYGKGANYLPWHNNIFNIPGEVLNKDELNRLIVIGTQEVKNSAGNTLWEELTDLVTIDSTYAGLPYDVSSEIESGRMTMIKEKVKYFREAAMKQYLEERPDIKKLLDERDQKIVDKNFIRDNLNKIREKQSRIENRQFLDQLN